MSGLLSSLGLGRGDVVSVVGAGGKTTLIYRLAWEAREAGLRVLVTTTTHMGTMPQEATGPVFVESEGDPISHLAEALLDDGRATVLGRRIRPDKLEGLTPERVDALAGHADLVLVEADGARGRSLKVPASHEPVVPGSTTLLLVVAALDVLGEPLGPDKVHRVELVSAVAGCPVGDPVDESVVARALGAPKGYLSRRPERARTGVFLNKVEGDWGPAGRIASLLAPPYLFVAAGSARNGVARLWP